MPLETLLFADASSDPEGCPAALFGVPFDGTASFRPGARLAPNAIRQASYNFETYHMDRRVDLADARFCDLGNTEEFGRSRAMVEAVEAFARVQTAAGRVTVGLGGEHSMTPPCVRAHGRPAFLVLDAHLDYREAYLKDPHSHACVTRRVAEHVGVDRVLAAGVRSMSRAEADAAEEHGLRFVPASRIIDEGVEGVLSAVEALPDPLYVSLDMDAVDPGWAPAVGNPEPFGLTPAHVRDVLAALAGRLVGFDLTEVSPPWDGGTTAALAARFVREVLAGLHQAERI